VRPWNGRRDISAQGRLARQRGRFCFCRLAVCRLIAAVHWPKVSLIGVGLLGGSLGLALRQRRLAGEVVGFARRSASVGEAERSGAVDRATLDLADAVRDADLIVLCTPLGQMAPLARAMLPHLKRGVVVTDVGSVKGSVVRELERLLARVGARLVAGHPMAGSEKAGVGAARADLFENAVCVLTPTPRTHAASLRKVEQLWRAVGSRVLRMEAAAHDRAVSRSSHLPHAVAAAVAHWVLDPGQADEVALLCAGGFRDTSRIASSSPEMWRDIALSNRKNLSRQLAGLAKSLVQLQQALDAGDAARVEAFYRTAKQRRDAWVAKSAPPAP
jgi:prephenate dehydrogenase